MPEEITRLFQNLTWELLIGLVGGHVGVLGVVLTGLTIFLSYRERVESRTWEYRKQIYEKQIQTYNELHQAMTNFYLDAQAALVVHQG